MNTSARGRRAAPRSRQSVAVALATPTQLSL